MTTGKVLYARRDKFIVKIINTQIKQCGKGEIIHVLKNSSIPHEIKAGDFIKFTGEITELKTAGFSSSEQKCTYAVTPDSCEISKPKKVEAIKIKPSRANEKSVEIKQAAIITDKKKATYNKFAIDEGDQGLYPVGSNQIVEGDLVNVTKIGRVFESDKLKKKICYVYFEKSIITPEMFMQATKEYYSVVEYIKKNGIKPRPKPEMIIQIKKCTIVCDSRNKLEGNAWLAFDDEFMWYITHKLSPIPIDNNIKIYNQFAQCWRISKRLVQGKIKQIQEIDQILFKSDIIPSA